MKLDMETQNALCELLKNAGVSDETIEMVKKDLGISEEAQEEEEPTIDSEKKPSVTVTEVSVSPAAKLMEGIKKMKSGI